MSQPATPQPRGGVSNRGDALGVAIVVVMFLGGLWLMAAPFIVGYQVRNRHWTTGTIDIFVVGAAISLLALATLIVFVAGVLFELARNSRRLPDETEPSGS